MRVLARSSISRRSGFRIGGPRSMGAGVVLLAMMMALFSPLGASGLAKRPSGAYSLLGSAGCFKGASTVGEGKRTVVVLPRAMLRGL